MDGMSGVAPFCVQPVAHRIGESGQLDAMSAHHADTTELQVLGEVDDGASLHQRRESLLRTQAASAGRASVRRQSWRDPATDDALAIIGLKPIDRVDAFGSRFQIGSSRPATMWSVLSANSGTSPTSPFQAAANGRENHSDDTRRTRVRASHPVPVGNSNPVIFVMQSAEDWAAKNTPCPLYGAR